MTGVSAFGVIKFVILVMTPCSLDMVTNISGEYAASIFRIEVKPLL
jgi:hypothetical protein